VISNYIVNGIYIYSGFDSKVSVAQKRKPRASVNHATICLNDTRNQG